MYICICNTYVCMCMFVFSCCPVTIPHKYFRLSMWHCCRCCCRPITLSLKQSTQEGFRFTKELSCWRHFFSEMHLHVVFFALCFNIFLSFFLNIFFHQWKCKFSCFCFFNKSLKLFHFVFGIFYFLFFGYREIRL